MERPIHFGILVRADLLAVGLSLSGGEKIQTGGRSKNRLPLRREMVRFVSTCRGGWWHPTYLHECTARRGRNSGGAIKVALYLQESRQNHTSAASGVAYAERRGATNPLNWTEVGPKTCLRSWGNARVRATRAGGHRLDPGHVHHFLLGITAFPLPFWGTDTIRSLPRREARL
jgi:hypothetical protein